MTEIKSPLKAIRQFCIDCCGGNTKDVRSCGNNSCVLHPFRFGKNPFLNRALTDEQKAASAARLAAARAKRNPN